MGEKASETDPSVMVPVNYNDLQAYMDTAYTDIFEKLPTKQEHISALNALDKMIAYIIDCEFRITNVEVLIALIPAKGTPEYDYTDDFETKLREAEEACFGKFGEDGTVLAAGLDADIIAHDDAEYVAHAAEGAYYVDGFDKLKDARKDYDEWNKVVVMLLDWIDDLIALDALREGDEGFATKGTDLINKYNDIQEYYQNGSVLPTEGARLTSNQSTKFKTSTKDFRGETTVPVHEILGQIFADITKNTGKTGTLVTDIDNLYNETVGAEKCVFAKRVRLEELMKTYNELESDEVRSYVTNYALLEEMWTEYQAELTLVKAWAETMKAVVTPVTVANWDKVDAAETAFGLLTHGEEVLGEELGLLQSAVSTDTEYKPVYDQYVEAINQREALKTAILNAVQAMMKVDTEKQLPEAIAAWKLAFDEIKAVVDVLTVMKAPSTTSRITVKSSSRMATRHRPARTAKRMTNIKRVLHCTRRMRSSSQSTIFTRVMRKMLRQR